MLATYVANVAVSILYPGSSLFVGGVPCKLFGFGARVGAMGPVPEAWERSIWVDSQDLATILGPFRVIFADLGPDRLSAT